MTDGGLQRTQYRNLATGTVRTGSTGHGESLADVESYFFPLEQTRNAALLDAGVAQGLTVQATAGSLGLTVLPGTAVDGYGRLIVLAAGGTAIVDPDVDPAQVLHVPTVLVPDTGLALPTGMPGGDLLLTLTWREVQADDAAATAVVLLHAPWLRLVASAGFVDSGDQVVLAAARLAADGTVIALTPGPRRRTGLMAGRLRLEAPQPVPGADAGRLGAGQQASAEVDGLAGGGLVVTVPAAAGLLTALTVDGATARVDVPLLHSAALSATTVTASSVASDTINGGQVSASSLTLRGAAGDVYQHMVGPDTSWRLHQVGSPGADRLVVDAGGNLSMALPPGTVASRIVHIEGGEIHSGGGAGGFSFSDRADGAFVDQPGNSGRRWVWYALGGTARLWSGADILTVGFSVPILHLFQPQPLVTVNGDLRVTGSISKGGGGFTIDHPLNPAHRLLSHSFVESPEMATLYTGTAVTGPDGIAEVVLPDYFAVLNTEARVHLTAVGSLVAVTVASPVRENTFTIRTAEPGTTVNWLVTGTRDDPWARAHRIKVETDKPGDEQGSYLHPEVISSRAGP
jgi:hypothetical protein